MKYMRMETAKLLTIMKEISAPISNKELSEEANTTVNNITKISKVMFESGFITREKCFSAQQYGRKNIFYVSITDVGKEALNKYCQRRNKRPSTNNAVSNAKKRQEYKLKIQKPPLIINSIFSPDNINLKKIRVWNSSTKI